MNDSPDEGLIILVLVPVLPDNAVDAGLIPERESRSVPEIDKLFGSWPEGRGGVEDSGLKGGRSIGWTQQHDGFVGFEQILQIRTHDWIIGVAIHELRGQVRVKGFNSGEFLGERNKILEAILPEPCDVGGRSGRVWRDFAAFGVASQDSSAGSERNQAKELSSR